MDHIDEFSEAVRLADLYIKDLDKIYKAGSNENKKAQRVDKFAKYIENQGIENFDAQRIFSVGCGSAFVEIELAKKFGWKIFCADASPKAVSLALKNVRNALKKEELHAGQISVFRQNVIEINGTSHELYSIVLCLDVIGAFTRENKKKFLKKLWSFTRPKNGRLLLTALSCVNEEVAQKYSSGNLIISESYQVKLFSEKMEIYFDLTNLLRPFPGDVNIIRLDDECILIDLIR